MLVFHLWHFFSSSHALLYNISSFPRLLSFKCVIIQQQISSFPGGLWPILSNTPLSLCTVKGVFSGCLKFSLKCHFSIFCHRSVSALLFPPQISEATYLNNEKAELMASTFVSHCCDTSTCQIRTTPLCPVFSHPFNHPPYLPYLGYLSY